MKSPTKGISQLNMKNDWFSLAANQIILAFTTQIPVFIRHIIAYVQIQQKSILLKVPKSLGEIRFLKNNEII